MKKIEKTVLEKVAKLTYAATSSVVNTTCRKLMYQPVMPKECDKLKKHF